MEQPDRLRVLVVDDYADVADSLALLPTRLGHEVHVARTGPGNCFEKGTVPLSSRGQSPFRNSFLDAAWRAAQFLLEIVQQRGRVEGLLEPAVNPSWTPF